MNRVRLLTVLATVAVVLAVSPWGFAESISLISSSGGVYDYELNAPAGVDVVFDPGQTITLSGLSDVTGASVTGVLVACFSSSFTPSSVAFTQTRVPFGCGFFPGTFGTLTVDSSVLTLGTVDFNMQTRTGTVTGTTQGPVAAAKVPEPASLLLLGTGLLGLVGLARRKRPRSPILGR